MSLMMVATAQQLPTPLAVLAACVDLDRIPLRLPTSYALVVVAKGREKDCQGLSGLSRCWRVPLTGRVGITDWPMLQDQKQGATHLRI